jgi:hypothetical protein
MGSKLLDFIRSWYFAFAIALFVFCPELRRIADFYTSAHKLSPFSVLPTASLCAAALFTLSQWKYLGTTFRVISAIWLAAFAVALAIGAVSTSPIAAGFDLLEFCSPIVFGIILAATHEDLVVLYRRVAGTMLVLSLISGTYAIYQYIAPPAWDVFWVLNSGLVSTGLPEPFGLRVFGTLNSYAAFAHFTALSLILNLPRLGRKNWRTVVAYVPCMIALLLTSDRTAWIAFALGLVVYSAVSPKRVVVYKSLGLTVVVCAAVSTALLFSFKGTDDVVSLFQQRFASLTDIGEDASFNDRQRQTAHALHLGLSEPLGQGLGSIGSAAIAGASGSTMTLDNGYLSRLVELGVLGFVAYLVTLAIALLTAWSAFRKSVTVEATASSLPSILATSLALQVMLIWIDFSTDSHTGLLGVFFWYSIFNVSTYGLVARKGAFVETKPSLRRRAAAT